MTEKLMSEKRYKRFYVSESENQLTIYDNEGLDDYYHLGNDERDVKGICKLLNEQQATINKKKELLKLIANACSFNKEHSVKEILRNEIKGIDTVTYESANAWHDYVLLSEFFEECYGEHWDND